MFGLYIKELIKMLIGVAIVSAVGLYFFPNKIMLAICGVLVLGAFGAAGDAVKTAKTEESKNRLRESLEETDDYEDDEETENIALQEEKKVVKSSNKKNDSIFDDIDLD
ncbi:MAG: hypothetical protein ACFNPZ_05505 [Fusobacterium polymorphum]